MPPLIDLSNPLALIGYAGMTAPGTLAFLPLFDPAHPEQSLVVRARLTRDLIPAEHRAEFVGTNGDAPPPTHIETGRMLCKIPHDIARNMRGPVEGRHVVYLAIVARGTYDRAASGLIVPAGVGGGSGIVVP